MKVTIEVADLKALIDGLNNACITYNEAISVIALSCELPNKLECLRQVPIEELHDRMGSLREVYKQLLTLEGAASLM